MRGQFLLAALGVVLTLDPSAAQSVPNADDVAKAFRSLSQTQQAEFRRLISAPARRMSARVHSPAIPPNASARTHAATLVAAEQPHTKSPAAGYPLWPGYTAYLRHDFADLGSLDRPITTQEAHGAEVAYTKDFQNKNTTWATQALAAAVYSGYLPEDPTGPSLFHVTAGAYAAVDRTLNSNAKFSDGNTEVVSAGALSEFNVTRFLGGTHYFRLRGGIVNDELKDKLQANATAEWIPNYYQMYFFVPIRLYGDLTVRFEPDVLLQYDTTSDIKKPLLFNNRLDALRIGPQGTLIFYSWDRINPFWSRLSAQFVYHYMYEAFSGRSLDYLRSSLTYNLTEDGNIALGASYKKGHEETSGKQDDVFRIALTAKY